VTPSVDIVIVTYNSAEHIGACLDSIAASDFTGPIHTVVVDNASSDDTIAVVTAHPAAVQLLASATNRGFAAACNQGIRATSGDLVLLLNPDACLEPATLERMVTYLNAHPQVAIVGPRLVQEDGSLQRDISATGLFPSFRQALFEYTRLGSLRPQSPWYRNYFLLDFDRVSNRRVAMVQGACFLFRRGILRDTGLLDEDFFLYFEETDFCKRAADRGWEIHYVGEAAARHIGSRSMQGGRPSARYFIASMYRFHRKHYGLAEAAALWAILMPYHGLRVVRLLVTDAFTPPDTQRRADLRTASERFVAHWTLLAAQRRPIVAAAAPAAG